jgi:glyoxylase-like metal-dependent hydrolase (beta-lactamase superfamily II)
MKIAKGLEVLVIRKEGVTGSGDMHPTLIFDDNDIILVDTGLPGQLNKIKVEMEKAGVAFAKLDRVIITHQDMDHIGSLADIVKESNNEVKVLSHNEEKPYIQGDKRPIKMTPERMAQIELQMNALPEDKRNEMKAMYSGIKANVDITVKNEEELSYCGGIVVIHTPGHTPGHISLYIKQYKALVTGDAMNVINGQLVGPNPQHTYNMAEAQNSLKKFTKYDIDTVICYHGGVFTDNPNKRIAELISNL